MDQDGASSRRARLESEVASLRERAESAEAALAQAQRLATLGTLVGSIAHEFNNILTPVLSYAQMASEYPDDAELVRRALERSMAGTEQAARIAASMLGFIRDDVVGDAPICHVGSALSDALLCLTRPLDRDGITLHSSIGTESWVRMSPAALQQVLLNLIVNARAAMRSRGTELSVRAARSTWNIGDGIESWVTIEVTDTGCGMSSEVSARVFEPFFRADGGAEHGCGLGLSVCAQLVTDAGGQIAVQSREGEGATFRVSLPAVSPHELTGGQSGDVVQGATPATTGSPA
ncbi:MAG: HAMP domain-containing sensor histidine kinase [Planctomycetota bacterium]